MYEGMDDPLLHDQGRGQAGEVVPILILKNVQSRIGGLVNHQQVWRSSKPPACAHTTCGPHHLCLGSSMCLGCSLYVPTPPADLPVCAQAVVCA